MAWIATARILRNVAVIRQSFRAALMLRRNIFEEEQTGFSADDNI
jgi:hypothetical protein